MFKQVHNVESLQHVRLLVSVAMKNTHSMNTSCRPHRVVTWLDCMVMRRDGTSSTWGEGVWLYQSLKGYKNLLLEQDNSFFTSPSTGPNMLLEKGYWKSGGNSSEGVVAVLVKRGGCLCNYNANSE